MIRKCIELERLGYSLPVIFHMTECLLYYGNLYTFVKHLKIYDMFIIIVWVSYQIESQHEQFLSLSLIHINVTSYLQTRDL